MGYLLSGLFGSVKNKIGGVIFSNWKGINTAREYKIPANPNTPDQQAQRTKFGRAVAMAQNLLPTLIVTFWDPFAVKMSGFNYFIKSVFPGLTSDGYITPSCLISKGTLEPIILNADPTYDTATGDIDFSWSPTLLGNGLGTDKVNFYAFDKTNNVVLGSDVGFEIRGSGVMTLNIATGLTATNVLIFAFCNRGTGSDFIVSNSHGLECLAP